MTLRTYLDKLDGEQLAVFAHDSRTKVAYLAQLKGGHRKPGPALARRLVAASRGGLTLADVRPDLWGDTA
jgi:hypothetical protein